MENKQKKAVRCILQIAFGIYMVGMIYFLFFCGQMGRIPSETYRYSIIPFKEIKRYYFYKEQIGTIRVILNLAGNIICFIPIGFMVPMLSVQNRGVFKTTCICFLLSFMIELIQLVTKVGACDIDDVILNTIGGLLGCLCYHIVYKIYYRFEVRE